MMENIKVSGVLYITDLLTKEGIIEKEEMASALERLLILSMVIELAIYYFL